MKKYIKSIITILAMVVLVQCNDQDSDVEPDSPDTGIVTDDSDNTEGTNEGYKFSYNNKADYENEASLVISGDEGVVTYYSTREGEVDELDAFSYEENGQIVTFEHNIARDTGWVYLENVDGEQAIICIRMFEKENGDFAIQSLIRDDYDASYLVFAEHLTSSDFFADVEPNGDRIKKSDDEDGLWSQIVAFIDITEQWKKDYTAPGKGQIVMDAIIDVENGSFIDDLGEDADDILKRYHRGVGIAKKAKGKLKSKAKGIVTEIKEDVFKYLQKKWWEYREEDCHGTPNGSAAYDACGICAGGETGKEPNATCLDCNGIPNGSATIDDCGVCSGGTTGKVVNATCADCDGVPNGTAAYDDCGVCAGGNTGREINACKDCHGTLNGSAAYDDCGICSGGTTGRDVNATCADCYGTPNGTAYYDDCNECVSGATGLVECYNPCGNNSAPVITSISVDCDDSNTDYNVFITFTADGAGFDYSGSYFGSLTTYPDSYPVRLEFDQDASTWSFAANSYSVSQISGDKFGGTIKMTIPLPSYCSPVGGYQKPVDWNGNWRVSLMDDCGLLSGYSEFRLTKYSWGTP